MGRKAIPIEERLAKYIEFTPGCWLWKGCKSPLGYGHIAINKRPHQAHRIAYEHFVGPIPIGLTLDHLCRNPQCVNPAHLEPVTMRENTLRGMGPSARSAQRQRCPNGHEYGLRPNGRHRKCQICINARQRERRKAQAEAL